MNKRRYFTQNNELYFDYNGIKFLREDLGGFSREEAGYLLPRVLKQCQDSYDQGRSIDTIVGTNGDAVRIRIRGKVVVRSK